MSLLPRSRLQCHLLRLNIKSELNDLFLWVGQKYFFGQMAGENYKTVKKWNIVREQLISLCALNKLPKSNDDFVKLMSEDLSLKNWNSQIFNSMCYFLLGIINAEERDKLIRWPLINIQTHTKFRKGVSAMVNNFQENYPWANIKKLPESYFMNPHGYQSKVVDFLLRLTNLAIHIALDDPELLMMHSGDDLSSKEFSIMCEVVSKAKSHEEKLINNNILPCKEFEDVKNEFCDKCIALRQDNDELNEQLNNLLKYGVSEGLIAGEGKPEINDLKEMKDKSLSELNNINEELSKYHEASQQLLTKIKASKNPMSLSAKDFGCHTSPPALNQATSRVCSDLYQLFQYITSKNSTKEDEEDFYEELKRAEKVLMEERQSLQSFLTKYTVP